jgi:hypothetical protein
MDALKFLPQAFFEFFARLVPGGVALVVWMVLLGGADHWPYILRTFAAGQLDTSNVAGIAIFVAISSAYGLGQLFAPLGKAAQRASEFAAASILIPARDTATRFVKKEPTKAKSISGDDYDWLRANAPALGELVAKIRSEHTMFYSLASIFAVASTAYLWTACFAWIKFVLLIVAAIACAGRGYSTRMTMRETAQKLRKSLDRTSSH